MTDFPEKETRAVKRPLEIRAADDGKRTLVGYAAVFDSWSGELYGFRERVQKGAFAESLADADNDVRAHADHRSDALSVIGRRSAGTLRLEEDDVGLRVEIDLPDTVTGRDLATNIEAGNVNAMSFGFVARKAEWEFKDGSDEVDERTLVAVDLREVSVVAYPAYQDAQVAVRSLEEARKKARADALDETPRYRARVRARRSVLKRKINP